LAANKGNEKANLDKLNRKTKGVTKQSEIFVLRSERKSSKKRLLKKKGQAPDHQRRRADGPTEFFIRGKKFWV